MQTDFILVYYYLVPYFSQNVRLSCIFIQWVAYINPNGFCNSKQGFGGEKSFGTFSVYVNISQLSFRVWYSLFSLLFPLFSRLPNTPLEDDNSRYAWLSLFALKRKEASLVVGQLQVVLMC